MSQFRRMLKSKIHRATVTHADLQYEGSLTIPPDLMKSADILEYENIVVWDVTNGSRFETYAITGLDGSRDICVNGAAAHLCRPGDTIIIASFAFLSEAEAHDYRPKLVFVDSFNHERMSRSEVPGPRFYSAMATV